MRKIGVDHNIWHVGDDFSIITVWVDDILIVTFLGLHRVHFLFSTCLLSLSHHVTNHPSTQSHDQSPD